MAMCVSRRRLATLMCGLTGALHSTGFAQAQAKPSTSVPGRVVSAPAPEEGAVATHLG